MSINWETFQDIEEFQTNSHSSGIQDYILGIGMSLIVLWFDIFYFLKPCLSKFMLCTSTGTCILLTVNGWSRCILIDIRIFPLGTSIGGNDLVAFFSVGVVNHITLHDLKLQSGHIYYATIKGRLLLINDVTHCHVTLKALYKLQLQDFAAWEIFK